VKRDTTAELLGKTAVVTGGTRGIGLAIAEAFLERGAKVVITGRKEDGVRAAVTSLKEKGFQSILGVAAHSSRPDDVARAFHEAATAFGTVQVVVNNAATNPSMAPLSSIELEAFDKIIETNLRGYLIVAREGIRRMREAGLGGSIINLSSVASFRTWPGLGAYGVSKAAVNMMTQVFAGELGKDGIRINGIAPGLVRTRFSEALWKDPKAEEKAAAKLPLGRIAEPEDITGAAVFLASDASRYLTGQTIVVDGGMMS
jgi:dehydrogenase/reductase SDR family protein 4